jgi:hypothetical protein
MADLGRAAALAASLTLAAGAAGAATITSDRLAGDAYALDPGQFTTLSTSFRTLDSVTTACGAPADGRSAILKCASDPVPDGRYHPDSNRPWIDSADIGELRWDLSFDKKVTAFGFGVTDANDQRGSWWSLEVDGTKVDHVAQQVDEGGPITWYTILFDTPVDRASLTFNTRPGDGYGIANASVAPVPLPVPALLLLTGVGALAAAGVKRRERKTI